MSYSTQEAGDAPPVLVLGGQENALSIARSFGRRKIPVYICADEGCFALKSRYCSKALVIPKGTRTQDYWTEVLLGDDELKLDGAVIFPASDEAVEYLAANRQALSKRFVIDDALPEISTAMLSKLATLELAQEHGCPTPAFYRIQGMKDVDRIADGILFPIMIKPVHSHLFCAHYPNKKYLIANDKAELRDKVQEMLSRQLEMIVTELIPGPDHLQSAYFSYMKADGEELFNYTHQIIRRFPKNSGSACLTVTKKLPATAEIGRKFFRSIGFRGLGHIEFKLDERDGRLKIIECNPRTSAAQAVVSKSGLDMPWHIYNYLLTRKEPTHTGYREGVRRWWVIIDILSFFELRRLGELSFTGWIKSIKGPPLVFPYFCLDDPLPFVHKAWKHLSHTIGKRIGNNGQGNKNISRRVERIDNAASGKGRL